MFFTSFQRHVRSSSWEAKRFDQYFRPGLPYIDGYKIFFVKSSALASPAIKNNLSLGETQWLFFEQALNAQQLNQTDAVNRNNVATTSERILEIFETVTGQFEQAM